MAIYLGNLTISDLERRTGYVFSDEDRKWLESHRQDDANIKFDSNKFHIFDLPFEIFASQKISDYLLKLLMKYEEIKPSKEQLQFAVVKETEEQKERRLKKEKEEKEWQDKLNNPNSVWNVKWHMLVPVRLKSLETGSECDMLYWCFINTYTTGRNNIPEIIDGTANILLDEEGFHGRFTLYDEEIVNDADKYEEYKYVVGAGFYNERGNYVGSNHHGVVFENITFNIKDAINRYIDINGQSKEIHFDKINEYKN